MAYQQQVQFAGMPVVSLRWPDFKALITAKNLAMQCVNTIDGYSIFATEGGVAYTTIIINPINDANYPWTDSDYSQSQNDIDYTDFTTNFMVNCNGTHASAVNLYRVPLTADNRPNFAPNAFPIWASLYFVGRGDDPTNGIGQGTIFQAASDGYGDTTVEWNYNDPIFVLGAIVTYTGAQLGDTLDYMIHAEPTVTGGGTQSVNLVNVGPGNIIVPMPSGGSTTVDLTTAVPIPNVTGTGFFDLAQGQIGRGTITPNYTQTGGYDLYDFLINITHVAVEVPMVGDNQRLEIIIESVTSMELLPHWDHKGVVHNSGHTGLKVSWCFAAARATSV